MSKTLDILLLNKLGDPRKLAERDLEHLMESAEEPLGPAANGLTSKILSMFVPRDGTSIPMEESIITQQLTKEFNYDPRHVELVLESLQSSNILQDMGSGQLRMVSSVLAHQVYNKIEAENLVLRKVENFIRDRYSIYLEKQHLLNQEDLNYISHYLPSISISKEEENFINKSRKNISSKRRRGVLIATIVISALTLLSTIAVFQYYQADKQRTLAENARIEAENLADELAIAHRTEEEKNKALAINNEQLASLAEKEAAAKAKLAILNRKNQALAEAAKKEAVKNAQLAEDNEKLAKKESDRAEENKKLADKNEELFEKAQEEADAKSKLADKNKELAKRNDNMRKLAFSYGLAKQSIQMDNEEAEVKALLAREAFEINIRDKKDGNILQPDVYMALYDGLKSIRANKGDIGFNQFINERGSIRSIVFSRDKAGSTFYTISSSGFLKKWTVEKWQEIDKPKVTVETLTKLGSVQNSLKISPNNKWLAVAGESSKVLLYNLKAFSKKGNNAKPKTIKAHGNSEILTLTFTPDSKRIITSGADNQLQEYIIKDEALNTLATTDSPIDAVTSSPLYPNHVYYGTTSGRAYELKLGGTPIELDFVRNNEKKWGVSAIGISRIENRKVVVIGHDNGLIKIIQDKNANMSSGNRLGYIPSKLHSARISDIKISPDGNYMGISSYDGKASMWYIDKMVNEAHYQPLIFAGERSWVTAFSFTPNTAHVILGYRDGQILFFNPDPNVYAEAICETLKRSMTHDEWQLYIGGALDLYYRESCSSTR